MYRLIVSNIMTTKKGTAATENKIKQPKLKLKNVEVVFANLEDEGFGRSLTIKVTNENETMINDFFKVNQIGNKKGNRRLPINEKETVEDACHILFRNLAMCHSVSAAILDID